MSTIIQQLETEQLKKIPEFMAGDTIAVDVRVKEGSRERVQKFEGLVIAKSNRGLNSSFTVRKISHGEGVERVFQAHSPIIAKIKVLRKGDVRRAKLYYLRELTGRAARIKEKITRKAKTVKKQADNNDAAPATSKQETAKQKTVSDKTQAPQKKPADKKAE